MKIRNPFKSNVASVDAKKDNKLSDEKQSPFKKVKKFGRRLATVVSEKVSKLQIGGKKKAKHDDNLLAMVEKMDPKLRQETEEHKSLIGDKLKASLADAEPAPPPKPPRTFADKPPSVPPREAPPPAPTTITDEPPPLPPRPATPLVTLREDQKAPPKPPRTFAEEPPSVPPKPKLSKGG